MKGEREGFTITTSRVERAHPPLNSGVPMDSLTGPQRVEARASDVIAALAIQITRDHPVSSALVRTLGDVRSLGDLTHKVSSLHGYDLLGSISAEVVRRYRTSSDDLVSFEVREAMLQWARESEGRIIEAQPVVGPKEVPIREKSGSEPKLGFKPSKSGKPRGPGSHTRFTRGKRD